MSCEFWIVGSLVNKAFFIIEVCLSDACIDLCIKCNRTAVVCSHHLPVAIQKSLVSLVVCISMYVGRHSVKWQLIRIFWRLI